MNGMPKSTPESLHICRFVNGISSDLTVYYVIVKLWLLSRYKIYSRWLVVLPDGHRPEGGTIDRRGYIL